MWQALECAFLTSLPLTPSGLWTWLLIFNCIGVLHLFLTLSEVGLGRAVFGKVVSLFYLQVLVGHSLPVPGEKGLSRIQPPKGTEKQ